MSDDAPIIAWQAANLLQLPGVLHGFTGRAGGVSSPPFATLNLSDTVGDLPERLATNRARSLAALGLPAARWASLVQVHGATVWDAAAPGAAQGRGDGLYSMQPEVALAALSADCVPILLGHASGSVVAAAHAGWRGTVAGVGPATLAAACAASHTAAADWQVAMGPAIGPCCFVIDAPVARALQAGCPAAAAVWPAAGRFRADLWEINATLLRQAGVPPTAIVTCRRCTRCHEEFFSCRRAAGGGFGCQAGIIARRAAAAGN